MSPCLLSVCGKEEIVWKYSYICTYFCKGKYRKDEPEWVFEHIFIKSWSLITCEYFTYLKIKLNQQEGDSGPRWQCRKTPNSPPPRNTSNLYLQTEQLPTEEESRADWTTAQQMRETSQKQVGAQETGRWTAHPTHSHLPWGTA